MRTVGIDIGSRSIKLAVWDGGKIVETRYDDTGFDPLTRAHKLLEGVDYERIMATGYGRSLLEVALDAPTVTEIKAHAVGTRHHFPEARTVLDIGGQDSKAIALNAAGKVVKFEMNDRCAAGTGKFLEIMAKTLGFSLSEFGREAARAGRELTINSMCTVFAESEVTSLVARGEDRNKIALGLHRSIVRRAVGMLKRVYEQGPIVFSGGVARNPCIRELIQESLNQDVLVADDPQSVGAIGAALIAANGASG